MKKRNPTIVSVTASKVGPREFEARKLVEWLITTPLGETTDSHPYKKAVQTTLERGGIRTLKLLANYGFTARVPGRPKDSLRVGSDGEQWLVGYLEHSPKTDEIEEHFISVCIQIYPHVVDAFRCFKMRFESDQPSRPALVK